MAESHIGVTEAATPDAKLHTNTRTIGAHTVEDEVVILGEPYIASYAVMAGAVSCATAGDHLIQLMAGASLNVRVRRISVYQNAAAASSTRMTLDIVRLTSAGTGGSALTPVKYESSDSAAGATGMQIPTANGTEGDILHRAAMRVVSTSVDQQDWVWHQLPNAKPFVIPAGTSNGIAVKHNTGTDASATVRIVIEFDETSF